MKSGDFFKKYMTDFLLIQAGITLAMGMIGCIAPPEEGLDHHILFMPFVYAAFCLLPSVVTYSSKELNIRQMVFRKIIQFLLIELVVLLISYLAGALFSTFMFMAIMLAVAVIYAAVNWIDYVVEKSASAAMTQKLQHIKEKEGEEKQQ